jgi:hypothetical protein
MMKTFSTGFMRVGILPAVVFYCLLVFCAFAQTSSPAKQITPGASAGTSPVKGIGTAPANSKQDKIIKDALSAETRQTLQAAMNSARASDTARPVPPAK